MVVTSAASSSLVSGFGVAVDLRAAIVGLLCCASRPSGPWPGRGAPADNFNVAPPRRLWLRLRSGNTPLPEHLDIGPLSYFSRSRYRPFGPTSLVVRSA